MPIIGTVASGYNVSITPTVEYLVVAGGGGGGYYHGGGGGSGEGASGGTGGSGIVIIRYADTYAAAVSATVTPTTAGGYRIYRFTANGSITF